MTEIVLGPLLTTYTLLPSGETTMPSGFGPTAIVATTVLVAVLATATVLLLTVVYSVPPSGEIATFDGFPLRAIFAVTVLVALLITDTDEA